MNVKVAEYKFNNTLADLIPEFNTEFTDYTYEDIVDGEVTTRTIYSDSLPTLMRFGTNILYANDYVKGSEVALISIEYLDTSNLTTCYNMFKRCTSLVSINTDGWNTSNVTTMDGMFSYCTNLTELDVSNFDTSNVTNMRDMFYECESLTTLDVSGWNTSKVTDMQWMFGVYGYGDETMMLTSIIGLENWDTSNVTNMEGMFCQCRNLTTLDVSNFDTSNVATMAFMFRACESLTELDVSNFDTSNVTAMICMFQACNSLTSINISNFDTSNVATMAYMFDDCLVLESIDDLSNWNVSSVTTMEGMFCACSNLVTVNATNWNTSNVINMAKMFGKKETSGSAPGCNNLERIIGIENWDTGKVTDMWCMFYGAYKLEALDLSKWNTSNVTDMAIMFCVAGHDNPNFSLNIKDWDVSNVLRMDYMFDCCASLKELDLSGWDVSNVISMSWMFGNDVEVDSMMLTKLNLSGWKFNDVYMDNFFSYTNRLNEVIMNDSNYTSVNKIITQLPTRTLGVMYVSRDILNDINISEAESKMWRILPLGGRVKNVYINGNNITNMITKQNKKIKGIYLGNTPLL